MDYEAYLLHKGLKTFDPYAQHNILPLEKQEPDRNLLKICNRYVVSSEKVFCHICGSKLHNNGFTGEIENDSKILFGSTCAKRYFNEETLKLAEISFSDMENAAHAEYKIKKIKGTASEMQRWLDRYRPLVNKISEVWQILLTEHQETIEEIFSHLEKNNWRLTEEYEQEASDISRAVGRHDQIVIKKLVCAIKNSTPLKTIKEFQKHFLLIGQLPSILLGLDDRTSNAQIIELDKKLRSNFLRSLDDFEKVLAITAELLTEPTFSQVCLWSDRQRVIKLRQQKTFSARNLSRTLRRKLGDGYELPVPMLSEILDGERFLLGDSEQSLTKQSTTA